MSLTRVRMTSRSSLSVDSSVDEPSRSAASRAAQRVELARQPLVLFGRARLLGLHPLDHADEQLQLFLEPIDRFELDAAGRCLRHIRHTPILDANVVYRCTAPCSRDERRQNRVDALLHFGVGQRAIGAWNVSRTDRLTAPVRHALALIAIEKR